VAADLYVAANRPASTASSAALLVGAVRTDDRLGL
jgi:hypothetical protein